MSTSRPATAATCSNATVSSGSSASRRRTTSRTPVGTSPSPAPLATRRASSVTKNGLPSARAWIASTVASVAAPSVARSTSSALASGSSPRSRSRWVPDRRVSVASVSTSSSLRPTSSSRTVQISSTGSLRNRSTIDRSNSSDAASAHWMSSSTRTTGRSVAQADSSAADGLEHGVAARVVARRRRGVGRRRQQPAEVRRDLDAGRSEFGERAQRRQPRPQRRVRRRPRTRGSTARSCPARWAAAATSSASRVFPIPGSPSRIDDARRRLPEHLEQLPQLGRPPHEWRRGFRRGSRRPRFARACRRRRDHRVWGKSSRRGGREVEGRIVVEDRGLELLQRASGIDAQLVAQGGAGVLDRPQGLGLPPGAVQREREARPQSLLQRMRLDELAELADQCRMPPERELGRDPVLDRGEAAILQPRDEPAGEVAVAVLRERGPAPQPFGFEQRPARCPRRRLRPAGPGPRRPVLSNRRKSTSASHQLEPVPGRLPPQDARLVAATRGRGRGRAAGARRRSAGLPTPRVEAPRPRRRRSAHRR